MGILGLFGYLSIFIAVAYYLIQLYKKKTISESSFIVLSLLFITYFIQNLFVFDSLNSLILFYAFLAFIYFLSNSNNPEENNESKVLARPVLSIPFVVIAFTWMFFSLNLTEIKANNNMFETYRERSRYDYSAMVEYFKQAAKVSVNKIDPAHLFSAALDLALYDDNYMALKEEKIANFKFATQLMNEAIRLDSKNMYLHYIQAKNYSHLFELTNDYKYYDLALEFTNNTKKLGPNRVRPYWVFSQIYLLNSKYDLALENLDKAISLNYTIPETYYFKSFALKAKGDLDGLDELYNLMIENDYPFYNLDEVHEILQYYDERGDVEKLIFFVERLTEIEPENLNHWENLVNLLVLDKQYNVALETLKEAAQVNPVYSYNALIKYKEIEQLMNNQYDEQNQ